MPDDATLKEGRAKADDFRKLMFTYAGFQMAVALLIAVKVGDICGVSIIIPLLAISIPSTFALGMLQRVTQDGERRNPHGINAVAYCFSFIPSGAAISLVLASVSIVAAVIFPVACVVWFAAIVRLRMNTNHLP